MSKLAKYEVEIQFSDELTEEQKDGIVENLINALTHEAQTAGITSTDDKYVDAFTEIITVSRPETNVSLCMDIITNQLI